MLRRLNGTYRKTVFLHFMVQENIISEGTGTDSTNENVQDKVHKKKKKKKGQFQKAKIAGCGWVKHRPQLRQKSYRNGLRCLKQPCVKA